MFKLFPTSLLFWKVNFEINVTTQHDSEDNIGNWNFSFEINPDSLNQAYSKSVKYWGGGGGDLFFFFFFEG